MEKIDMSLEDIIKGDKSLRNIGRGGGRGGNRGRRGNSRGNNTGNRNNGSIRGNRGPARGGILKKRQQQQPLKSNRNQANVNSTWKHDMFDGVGRSTNNTSDGRLLVSNLDFGVNDSDIKELFSEFGPLRKAAVHYDRSGRSSGTAEVHFEKRNDAVRALKQYNNVPLDGRSMDIKLIGADLRDRNQQRPRNNNTRGQSRGSRGMTRGGGNRGRGGRSNITITSDELDKQLDAYNSRMDTD